MSYISELASSLIEDFDTQEERYTSAPSDLIVVKGNGAVLTKDLIAGRLNVNFGKTSGCKVYVGRKFKGSVSIDFHGDCSYVYIGNGCTLNGVAIRSIHTGKNEILVGNGVTTTNSCTWYSGDGAGGGGSAKPALIIGDDCMFAWDITIRNTDAHPIYRMRDDFQLNEPASGVVIIEPHVWIAQGASILKEVTIGACSIIGLGSVVTSDIPRFSSAKGVPAKYSTNQDLYWSRSASESSKERARFFMEKYRSNVV